MANKSSTITVNSDVTLTGALTNGTLTKAGAGTLTLKGAGSSFGGLYVTSGSLVIDGFSMTNSGGLRMYGATAGATARFVVKSNSRLLVPA